MPVKAAIITRPQNVVSPLMRAVAGGLQAAGVDVVTVPGGQAVPTCDFVATWGWRRGAELQRLGHRVLVVERGYIGDRYHWTSLAWDGLNGRGDFCLGGEIPPLDDSRADLLGDLTKSWRPERQSDDYILVMGQVPGDQSLQGLDLSTWYRETMRHAEAVHGVAAILRPHPEALRRGITRPYAGLRQATGTLAECLGKAALVVTYNSNSAVDAVLAGVPAVTADPGSMAWDVTSHDLKEIVRPPRTLWSARLSWCQWSPSELAAGAWWDRLKSRLDRAPHQESGQSLRNSKQGGRDGTFSRHAAAR